jgi:hypothetical protein
MRTRQGRRRVAGIRMRRHQLKYADKRLRYYIDIEARYCLVLDERGLRLELKEPKEEARDDQA